MQRTRLLALALFIGSGINASAQHHLYTFRGDTPNDRFGSSVAAAGDVDRDGTPDVIVGAAFSDATGTDAGTATVFSGRDGRVLYTFYGNSAGDNFGYSVAGAGDVNSDGFADLIIGAPGDDNNSQIDSGSAKVISGKDGKTIFTVNGNVANDNFGSAVASVGDVNRDGYPDLVVGAILDSMGIAYRGSARVVSGKDGKAIHTFYGDSERDHMGNSVAGAGDVNADGYPDVVVGAYANDTNGSNSGSARVFSGKDGKVLYTFDGPSESWFGSSVSTAGDVNHDGFDDVLVGASHDSSNGTRRGSATVLSGKDGTVLLKLFGKSADDRFGTDACSAGDVNQDGTPDFIVAAPTADSNGTDSGSATVFSGKDGKPLHIFNGDAAGDQFGSSVSTAADLNNDGWPDIVVGAWDTQGTGVGSARVLSGKALSLWTDQHLLKLNKAGTQNLSIDVSSVHAGRLYWVFGSVTGTTPGVTLGGIHVPLNPDPYTDVVMASSNTSLFASFWGTLNSQGRAAASINIPAAHPPLLDITLFHAALVYEPNGSLHAATNAVTIRLEN